MKLQKFSPHRLFLHILLVLENVQIIVCLINEAYFSRQPFCEIDNSCLRQLATVRSRVECLTLCSQNPSCESVLYVTSTNTCYENTGCDLDPACLNFDPNLCSYRKVNSGGEEQTTSAPCLYGGQLNSQTGNCNCSNTGGYGGDRCQYQITTCQALADANVNTGFHMIAMDLFGDGSTIIQTHCEIFNSLHTFTVMRSSGTVGKGLSWTDYRDGFWISEEDYWIGLENLHRFTGDGNNHRLRVSVAFNSSLILGSIKESSHSFVVGSASTGYAYSISSQYNMFSSVYIAGKKVELDNFLYSQSEKPFSTADNDQDGDGQRNCAELAGAGWWFGSCDPFTANPLGWSYAALPGTTTDSHIRFPGVDMSHPDLAHAFERVYLTIDL